MPESALVRLSHVTKTYRLRERTMLSAHMRELLTRRTQPQNETRTALHDISLELVRGETLGVIGLNGAGKSTLLKLIAGILRPTQGTLEVNARVASVIELGAGFHPDLTGRENIFLNGALLGLKRRELDARFDEIVAFAELEHAIDMPVKQYSSGMYARLGFAIASNVSADVLLIDEVLAVGDLPFVQKCMTHIAKLRRNGVALVLVSHQLATMRALATRALLLHHGECVALGLPDPVVNQYVTLAYPQDDDTPVHGAPMRSGNGQRSGTFHARIKWANWLDADHKPTRSIPADLPASVHIEYEATTHVSNPTIRIRIEDEYRTHLFTADTRLDSYVVGELTGRGVIELEVDSLRLEPGNYFLSVEIADELGLTPYDLHDNAYPFNVYRKIKPAEGIHMTHRWRLIPSENNSTL